MEKKFSDKEIDTVKKLLSKTVEISHYNGWTNRSKYGYHSFNIDNLSIKGQREPSQRLTIIKKHINFENKNVIDFGCNSGGMLFHLPEIKQGIGIDYDKNCIEFCDYFNSLLKRNNEFLVADLNTFNYDTLLNKNLNTDIIFLLSLGSWIKEWKILFDFSINNSKTIIFETNNDVEGKPHLLYFKEKGCVINLISQSSHDDMTGNYGRKTYIITNK